MLFLVYYHEFTVRFIVKDSSVGLHSWFHSTVTLTYQFLYMAIQLFAV
jgi:hypothetical protein